jgi:hypothetical protein
LPSVVPAFPSAAFGISIDTTPLGPSVNEPFVAPSIV